MPRTIAVDCPGCPPVRALTFDVLGLTKVIESRGGTATTPKIVQSWGEPDASRCVLSASINDSKFDPLLALARKNGHIELVNPLNGDVRASVIHESAVEDPVAGLYLFKKENSEMSSRSVTLLTCTAKGNAALRSIEVSNPPKESTSTAQPTTWTVCTSGDVLCSAVDGNESHAIFGGKGVEINLWNLENCSKIWSAKPPPKNNLDIFTPTWFTAAAFLGEDHRKIAAGTNNHQVRLYDASAQRRPVLSVDFRESPIKAVTGDPDGHTIYFGTGSGDLASVDIRTGKVLGCFLGKCSGSIRSIVRHPELPLIVSCGLDRYVRFWNVKTRQLLSAVFLKQHLTNVVIDSNFSDEVPAVAVVNPSGNEAEMDLNHDEDDTSPQLTKKKKKKSSKEGKQKSKSKKTSSVTVEDNNCVAVNSPSDEEHGTVDQDEDDSSAPVKKKKVLIEDKQKKKSKKKAIVEAEDYSTAVDSKSNEVQVSGGNEVEDDVSPVATKRKKTLKEGKQNKKLKSKKNIKKVEDEDD